MKYCGGETPPEKKRGKTMKTIKEIREKTGLSRPVFGAKYGLTVRSLENWELKSSNRRQAPDYLVNLLDYKVESDLKTVPMSYVVKSVSSDGQEAVLGLFPSLTKAKDFIGATDDAASLRVSFQRLTWNDDEGTFDVDKDSPNECENRDVTDMVMGRDK